MSTLEIDPHPLMQKSNSAVEITIRSSVALYVRQWSTLSLKTMYAYARYIQTYITQYTALILVISIEIALKLANFADNSF